MSKFEIFTDTSCDLPKEIVERFDLHVMQLEVIMDDQPPVLNDQVEIKEFYHKLRTGSLAKTAAVTPGFFDEEMRKCIAEGSDILYIGFSSGLSATYSNGIMIMKELRKEFPERKLYDVDSLAATSGQGLLVYYAAMLKEEGLTIEEVRDKIEATKDYMHHILTFDDLFFLKRGGRIDAATAIAGSVLKFKPISIINKEGKLQNIGRVRGRKAAIKELFTQMKNNENVECLNKVILSHSDCLEDANILADMIREEWKTVEVVVCDMGPVIGAHAGPGSLILSYLGKSKKGE